MRSSSVSLLSISSFAAMAESLTTAAFSPRESAVSLSLDGMNLSASSESFSPAVLLILSAASMAAALISPTDLTGLNGSLGIVVLLQ